MKLRLSLTLLGLIMLAACGSPQPAAPASAPAAAPTTAPEVKPTSAPPTQPPAAPEVKPTSAPPTQLPAVVLPTNTSAPAATKPAPTEPPPAPTNTATAAPAATKPRPTPSPAGPLSAAIYPANCRSAPTADKPGGVIVQISVEASGGNGRYRYFYQDRESPTKFIEVIGEKGTRLIGDVKITSGDGQEIKKEFDIAINQLTCP